MSLSEREKTIAFISHKRRDTVPVSLSEREKMIAFISHKRMDTVPVSLSEREKNICIYNFPVISYLHPKPINPFRQNQPHYMWGHGCRVPTDGDVHGSRRSHQYCPVCHYLTAGSNLQLEPHVGGGFLDFVDLFCRCGLEQLATVCSVEVKVGRQDTRCLKIPFKAGEKHR